MSVKSATEFLMDIQNHSDVPARAAQADVTGLMALANEIGYEDVSEDDITTAITEIGGDSDDDDEVTGFALGAASLGSLGIDMGGVSLGEFGTLGAKSGPSSSTHGPSRRKWPKPGCDCDDD